MNKSDIKEELISKMKIELKDTLFYMPGETIEGTIKLFPEYKLKIKDNKLHLKLNFLQYEFWEYNNTKIDELKNIYKTDLDSSNFEYNLIDEEQQDFEENKKFGNFSVLLIEKEDKKSIEIPFKFKINEKNTKLLPTFQYETDKYILGIRHLLTVKCEEYNSTNYIGLFIGKIKDENFIQPKTINMEYNTLLDKINIEIKLSKQSFWFGEKINFEFGSKSKHTYGRNWNFKNIFYRKIEWKGYLKNSLLDKKIFAVDDNSEIHYENKNDDDEFGILEYCSYLAIYGLVGEGLGGVTGAIGGGLILKNSYLLLGSFFGGCISGLIGAFGGGLLGMLILNYSPQTTNFSEKYALEASKENNNINDKIKEELLKFIFFKDNKIVGFIKFKENITPPVNGYYFKCDFNLKIETMIPGLISNSDNKKAVKLKLDFYDGEKYILDMKKLLSLNK